MREFIYKAIIVAVLFGIFFEFTIGKRLDPLVNSMNTLSDKQGRKDLKNKLRKEMKKGIEKEYMLNEDDRILIFKFINKLKKEINSVDTN